MSLPKRKFTRTKTNRKRDPSAEPDGFDPEVLDPRPRILSLSNFDLTLPLCPASSFIPPSERPDSAKTASTRTTRESSSRGRSTGVRKSSDPPSQDLDRRKEERSPDPARRLRRQSSSSTIRGTDSRERSVTPSRFSYYKPRNTSTLFSSKEDRKSCMPLLDLTNIAGSSGSSKDKDEDDDEGFFESIAGFDPDVDLEDSRHDALLEAIGEPIVQPSVPADPSQVIKEKWFCDSPPICNEAMMPSSEMEQSSSLWWDYKRLSFQDMTMDVQFVQGRHHSTWDISLEECNNGGFLVVPLEIYLSRKDGLDPKRIFPHMQRAKLSFVFFALGDPYRKSRPSALTAPWVEPYQTVNAKRGPSDFFVPSTGASISYQRFPSFEKISDNIQPKKGIHFDSVGWVFDDFPEGGTLTLKAWVPIPIKESDIMYRGTREFGFVSVITLGDEDGVIRRLEGMQTMSISHLTKKNDMAGGPMLCCKL